MTRARGTGSITPHQGGFWARLPVDGKSKSLGVHPTYELAEDALHAALMQRAATPGASAMQHTFASFGRFVLDLREEEGVRSIRGERRSFELHLEGCAFADKAVQDVTSADIADLLKALAKKTPATRTQSTQKIKRTTIQRNRALLSAIFKTAVERGLRAANPCTGVRVKGSKRAESDDPDDDELWDWLRGDEQQAFLACPEIEPWFKAMVRVAWGTGLRQGEMWNLETKDVHMPVLRGEGCVCGALRCLRLRERGAHIHVRYGARGHLPPKNGLSRTTPLFGEGLAGMRAWLEILPSYAPSNPSKLVFPSMRGCRRWPGGPRRKGPLDAKGKQTVIFLLPEALAKIGITRNVRWHDLRHTCASSLISGVWGKTWNLLPTRDMLGHKDIQTTQRYAHLASDVLHDEGASTPGHVTDGVIPSPDGDVEVHENATEKAQSATVLAHGPLIPTTTESNHAVRFIPNTSIAREAASELLRLFGSDALRLALALAGSGANSNEKSE